MGGVAVIGVVGIVDISIGVGNVVVVYSSWCCCIAVVLAVYSGCSGLGISVGVLGSIFWFGSCMRYTVVFVVVVVLWVFVLWSVGVCSGLVRFIVVSLL
jgi:hypothetical protein